MLLLILAGCTPVYHPASLHVTHFDAAKQVSLRASAGSNGGQVQAAYSVLKNVAVHGGVHGIVDGAGYFGTVGGGVQMFMARTVRHTSFGLELHGGYVNKSFDGSGNSILRSRDFDLTAPVFQVALPVAQGWQWEWFAGGMAMRMLLHGNYARTWSQPNGGVTVDLAMEVGGFMRFGKTVQVELQGTLVSMPLRATTGTYEYLPFSGVIGIVYQPGRK